SMAVVGRVLMRDGSCGEVRRVGATGGRDPAVNGGGERGRRRVAQGVVQQRPGVRSVCQIGGAVVAPREADPLGGDAQVALGRAGGIGGEERGGVQLGPSSQVVHDAAFRDRGGDGAPCVLQQGDQV